MNRMSLLSCILLIAFLGVLTDVVTPLHAIEYSITDLGTMDGAHCWANGINASGQVVGYTRNTYHVFLYTNGVLQHLFWGEASAINNNSQVVGEYYNAESSALHAILYANGSFQDLGTLGGNDSRANGINNYGQVVGYSHITGSTANHAFLYTDGVMQDLGTLGGSYSYAYGINDSGQVVGYSYPSGDSTYHAFLYSGGEMQDLGTLGGRKSWANKINAGGQIVGGSNNNMYNSPRHAFLYTNDLMQDLGTLGGTVSEANDINASGQVVGYSQITGDLAYHAFLYSDGVMTDLNALLPVDSGWTLIDARAINDSGQIAGNGINPDGYDSAFLLTPIPEPATVGLMLLGGMAVMRKRGGIRKQGRRWKIF